MSYEELLAKLMDENAKRAQPFDAKQVMYEALITSAIDSAKLAQSMGMSANQILLSCKVSGVQDLISVYRELAGRCRYPLHLGLTEAGMGTKGLVWSASAMGVLLARLMFGEGTNDDAIAVGLDVDSLSPARFRSVR